ncbi:MAG: hypothetical protein CBD97_02035 [Pelagibacteraceae bacterium TMED237]|nr:MAG: hypothetical protein CBD97_02035 [Pelagibacteraceae bacterium TMED237]|tara:strand:+ start:282 stop:2708 length:2427 start_codon:yes stop_codon:yes gene_type:complete
MKLKLVNFLCYTDKTIEFGDEGITLISGPSGCGKTSILRAIFFVLFGEGNKVQHYGKTSCTVELYFEDMKIVRTKRPNRLIVNDIYEDNSAQEIINKRFGDTFKTSGYIQQNNISSFILMSPNDKLFFLEKFAFSNIDLSEIKKKCGKYINQLHDEHLIIISNLQTNREILADIKLPQKIKFPIKTNDKETTIKNENKRLNNTLIKLKKNLDNQNIIESKIFHLSVLNASSKSKKDIIDTNIDRIYTLENKIEENVITDLEIIQLEERLIFLVNNKKMIDKFEKYKVDKDNLNKIKEEELNKYKHKLEHLKKDLWSEFSQIEIKETIEWDDIYIKDMEKIEYIQKEILHLDYSDIEDKKNEVYVKEKELNIKKKLVVQLELQQNLYNCPSCKVCLKLEDKKLVFSDTELNEELNNDSISQLNREIKIISEEVDRNKSEIIEKSEHLCKYNQCKKKIKELSDKYSEFPDISILKEDIKYLQNYEREQLLQINIIKQIEDKIENNIFSDTYKYLEENIKQIEIDTDFSKLKTNTIFDNEEEEEIRNKLQEQKKINLTNTSINEEINFLLTKNKEIEEEILHLVHIYKSKFKELEKIEYLEVELQEYKDKNKELQILKDKYTNHLETIKLWQQYQEALDNYNLKQKKIKDLEKKEKEVQNKYASAINLKSKILEAESIAMSNIVESINNHARCYLDIFFETNPISVQLQTFKENKKDTKPCINIAIEYKGMECELSMLSGGEISRVILSYTLALSEIFNTPLLLLDECTSSLDEHLTDIVFEGIKENFNGKLVLIIAHQVVCGKFDKIIKL